MFRPHPKDSQEEHEEEDNEDVLDWSDDSMDSDGSVYDSSSFVSSGDDTNDDDDNDDDDDDNDDGDSSSSHSEYSSSSSSASSGSHFSSEHSYDDNDDDDDEAKESLLGGRPRDKYYHKRPPPKWRHEIGAVAGDLVSSLRRRVGTNTSHHHPTRHRHTTSRHTSSSTHYIDIHDEHPTKKDPYDDGGPSDSESESEGRTKRQYHNATTWKRNPYMKWVRTCFQLYYERCPGFFDRMSRISSRLSTLILIVAFLIFLHSLTVTYVLEQSPTTRVYFQEAPPRRGLTPAQSLALKHQRTKQARHALGSAAGRTSGGAREMIRGAVQSLFSYRHSKKHRNHNRPEGAPSGCQYVEWQTQAFPTCNEIHEVDLADELHMRHKSHNFLQELDVELGKQITRRTGYVGSGLYRSVFKVDPRREATLVDDDNTIDAPVVLKIMKSTQKVDGRNLDRHRRDALVMEELQSASNVVSIYGYCGNTLLTEYIPVDLGTLIYDGVDVPRLGASPTDTHPTHTRKTPLGRLHLAWDVARGLAAVHGLQGPVLHADVQAKQFLVHPYYGVKVNDFNRCRLMPESKKKRGEFCFVPIPSAPGVSRSPEEYEGKKLSFQIDVYSAAHMYFGILTGMKPWRDLPSSTIKAKAKSGSKPPLPQGCCESKSDKALANLMYQAYEHDPEKRITASQLARELEKLIQTYEDS